MEGGKFEDMRRNTYVRWIAFVVALFQAIRLIAMRGVLLTQVCGAIYLSSFIAIECLARASSRGRSDAPSENGVEPVVDSRVKSWETYLAVISLHLHLAYCIWRLVVLLLTGHSQVANRGVLIYLGYFSAVILFGSLEIQLGLKLSGDMEHVLDEQDLGKPASFLRYAAIFPASILCASMFFNFFIEILSSSVSLPEERRSFATATISFVGGLVFLAIALVVLCHVIGGWDFDHWRVVDVGFSLDFIALNVVTGLLYYTVSYEADRTYGPPWLPILG